MKIKWNVPSSRKPEPPKMKVHTGRVSDRMKASQRQAMIDRQKPQPYKAGVAATLGDGIAELLGECVYYFNGCAHPQFCKTGCKGKPHAPDE